jgi:hypothetical protein
MRWVLGLLIVQAVMGAIDTLWHHELAAALPSRPGARRELLLHGVREAIYGALFIGLSMFEFHGAFAWVVAGLLLAEVAITLADFIEEDRTRRLPASERVLHTLMAIGFGVILAAFGPLIWGWAAGSTALTWRPHGWLSAALLLAAGGVLFWAVRDLAASTSHRERSISTAPREGTVLITGATGFIGRAVTAALLAQGRRVMILTRDARAARAQFGPAPLIVENLDHVPSEMRIEAVVNLAGALVAGGWWTERRRRILLQSRIHTTQALIALMGRLERAPGALINASAVGFYGDAGETFVDEAAPPRAGFMGELVRRWEEEAFRAEGLGVRTCLLRLGLVLDWSGGVLPLLALPARLGLGATLGEGRQWAPWIHRDDVVRLILTAIDEPAWRGPVNAVAPDLVTQGEFTRRLARHFGMPAWLKVPAWPVRAALGEMADLFLAGQRALPARLWDLGFRFTRPTLESALERPTGPLRLPSPRPIRSAPHPMRHAASKVPSALEGEGVAAGDG